VNVLVVAAHPDDELLGAGGTVARHTASGDHVKLAVMCEGVSLRYNPEWDAQVRKQASDAARILGTDDLFMGNLPDQRLETIPLQEVASKIEKLIEECHPEVIYTHFAGDINRDHQVLAEAVMVAARPYSAPCVKEILMFETPSSTEWSSPVVTAPFQANVFVDIEKYLKQKIDAFSCYTREVREYPHPRSPRALKERARYWGSTMNRMAVEAFVQVRSLR
jgi:N-acetylglucosamine malate deacetylase 1